MALSTSPTINKFVISADTRSGCAYHRLWLPFQYGKFVTNKETFVFNRLPLGGLHELEGMKRLGYKVVCDIDDYWVLPKTHYLYDAWRANGFDWRIPKAIQLADVVTTTTAHLAGKITPLNKNVVVVPNALPFDKGQFQPRYDKDCTTPFVYVAGESHRRDLWSTGNALNREDVTLAGYCPGSAEWALMAASHPKANFVRGAALRSYMRLYDGHRVALAPLISNTFNRCKSNLKVLEAGAMRMPIICAKTLPYLNDLDRKFVTYANSPDEWLRAMNLYRKLPSLARDDGARLAEHVRQHYHLDRVNELRRQVYASL